MKKKLISLFLVTVSLGVKAQVTTTSQVSTFEDVTSLPNYHNKVYNDSTGGGGFKSHNAFFPTQWDTSYGGYWAGGWAASAFYDSTHAGYRNLYGCMAYNGYNHSNTFAVGTTSSNLIIALTDSLVGRTVTGMYICNSTYAYRSMKYGDSFEPAFTARNKDWFKLTVKKYFGGLDKTDSTEIYLADFRYADTTQNYILKTWTWVDLKSLGNTDSLAFYLHSSQNGSFGMNTPAFFCIDNFTLNTFRDTTQIEGLKNYETIRNLLVYPNPTVAETELIYQTQTSVPVALQLIDLLGNEVYSQRAQTYVGINKFKMDLSDLPAGVYYVNLRAGNDFVSKKIIKQ